MANNLFKWDKNCENSGILGFGCHLGRHLEYLNVIFVLRNEFRRGAHEYLYHFKMAAIFQKGRHLKYHIGNI